LGATSAFIVRAQRATSISKSAWFMTSGAGSAIQTRIYPFQLYEWSLYSRIFRRSLCWSSASSPFRTGTSLACYRASSAAESDRLPRPR
jgi:hypothetical protein